MATSQWEYIDHGDVEAAIVDILLNYTPQLDVWSPTISTNKIGYEFGARWVCVNLEGGSEKLFVVNKPRIDVEVFAERRSVAHDIASNCLASIKYQMGRYRGNGLFLSDARVEQGLTKIPEKLQGCSRYVFALRLVTRSSGTLIPAS